MTLKFTILKQNAFITVAQSFCESSVQDHPLRVSHRDVLKVSTYAAVSCCQWGLTGKDALAKSSFIFVVRIQFPIHVVLRTQFLRRSQLKGILRSPLPEKPLHIAPHHMARSKYVVKRDFKDVVICYLSISMISHHFCLVYFV